MKDLFCGYDLTKTEKDLLIYLTLKEFERPVRHRATPRFLVNQAKELSEKINYLRIY